MASSLRAILTNLKYKTSNLKSHDEHKGRWHQRIICKSKYTLHVYSFAIVKSPKLEEVGYLEKARKSKHTELYTTF